MSILTQSELVKQVAAETKLSPNDVESVVKALLDAITATLKKGDEMRFTGFGTFSVKAVAERTGRNPRTGETIQIKASNKVAFKTGKALSDALNKD